jgi:hypothetical protein
MSGPVIVLDGKISKFPYPLYPKLKINYTRSYQITIPPISGVHEYELELLEMDYELYGVVVSNSGYKDLDSFSLVVNNQYVMQDIYTKEYIQAKSLRVVKSIPKTFRNVKFLFNNVTGTFKTVTIDLDFVVSGIKESVEKFEIRPESINLGINTKYQFRAYYVLDGNEVDVTEQCEWSTTDYVISKGLLKGLNHSGDATITANYKNFSDTSSARVSYILPTRVIIRMWDAGVNDNDTVNLHLDGKLIAGHVTLRTLPNYVDISLKMDHGDHILRIEALRSDEADCTASVRICNSNKDGLYETSYLIPVPINGVFIDPPYPYVEWYFKVL